LINNFMCGVQAASLAEAMALVEMSGLDRAQALGVLTNGAPGSPLVKAVSARMAAREYTRRTSRSRS
jgi:3-hydroxyisobutyrate dehydrogenase